MPTAPAQVRRVFRRPRHRWAGATSSHHFRRRRRIHADVLHHGAAAAVGGNVRAHPAAVRVDPGRPREPGGLPRRAPDRSGVLGLGEIRRTFTRGLREGGRHHPRGARPPCASGREERAAAATAPLRQLATTYIGGTWPFRPTLTRGALRLPSALRSALMNTGAPALSWDRSVGA